MRFKTIATIVLAIFVLAAVAVIVMQRFAPAPTGGIGGASTPSTSANAPRDAEPPVFSDTPPAMVVAADTAVKEAVGKPVAERREAPATPVRKSRTASRPSEEPAAAPAENRKIVATYFHGNVRCATCRKVEAYAREAVEEGFRPEVAAGVVEFRAVNVEVAENGHFVEDYRLTNKSVIVTEEVNGVVARWAKLDEVWGLVGNHDAYLGYVRDAVRGYLEAP
ncbi:MAG: nitrophenyl compound nitroreductase subunit ArsF family protein [Thermoanaerobaculia bacterium]|jgi:hypothetical protein